MARIKRIVTVPKKPTGNTVISVSESPRGDAFEAGRSASDIAVEFEPIDRITATSIDGVDDDDDDDDDGVVDPESIGDSDGIGTGENSGSGTRKRRGPKPGFKRKSKKRNTETQKTITTMLYSTHLMLSKLVKVPELELDEAEAEQLGAAINNVAALYDIPMLDEKTMAWVQLSIVAGSVYGPRFVSVSMRRNKKLATPINGGLKAV